MGLPNINIEFKTAGITAITRSQKGVVALLIKETTKAGAYRLTSVTDIPTGFTAENKAYIERAFTGYQTPPKAVIVYALSAEEEVSEGLKYFATQKFDYICGTPDCDGSQANTIATWVKSERADNHAIYKAVLPECAADSEAVINFTAEEISDGKKTYTAAEYCSRIAGIIAGTPMTISCTYAPLNELTDIKRMTEQEGNTAVDNGKLILINDGEKVKIGRAVNSFVTTVDGKGDSFKKIKIVEAMDMINNDIRKTAEDSYIGKYANSYDNKCLLITSIQGYLDGLETDGIIAEGSECGINIEYQRNYLKSKGTDVEEMTDEEIKKADTGSNVFIKVSAKILDAIEDIDIQVGI